MLTVVTVVRLDPLLPFLFHDIWRSVIYVGLALL